MAKLKQVPIVDIAPFLDGSDKMGVAHQKHEVQVPAPGNEQQ